ncbi:MAG TPA: FMN-binding protein [Bacteroidales bacterium]|nr:FMN-binding protein [Bacteroidales bacterium]
MNRTLKYLMIVVVLTLLFSGYQYFKHAGLKAYHYVSRSEVALDSLDDGHYYGSFSPFDVIPLAQVTFQVSNGKVNEFKISRLVVTPWNKVKPALQDSVRSKKNLQFDSVTGATRSSFFVKAAVHNACNSDEKKEKKSR